MTKSRYIQPIPFLSLAASLLSAPLFATSTDGPTGPAPVSFWPILLSLALVIACIVIMAALLKRMNLGFPGSKAIKVVTALSMGSKERIVVIEINGQQHLIGVTPQNINHLVTLEQPLDIDKPSPISGSSFQKIFQSVVKKND